MFKRYADDYETEITTDEQGREKKVAVYRGQYFEVELTEAELSRFKRNSLLLLAAILFVHTASGFVANQGMNQFYIALAYVLAFFPILYLVMGALRLPSEKRKYRRDEIGLSFDRMKSTSHILLILVGIALVGEVAFLVFFFNGDQYTREIIFLALEVLAAVAIFFVVRMQRNVQVRALAEPSSHSKE